VAFSHELVNFVGTFYWVICSPCWVSVTFWFYTSDEVFKWVGSQSRPPGMMLPSWSSVPSSYYMTHVYIVQGNIITVH